jgi:hypothetical protein
MSYRNSIWLSTLIEEQNLDNFKITIALIKANKPEYLSYCYRSLIQRFKARKEQHPWAIGGAQEMDEEGVPTGDE